MSKVYRGSIANPSNAARAPVTWDDLASVLDLSAKTAALEVTPAPRGKPGGGLYDVKGLEHVPYFQQVVKALIEKRGMPPGKAYAIAYGALRKWERGGSHTHPEVRAAAASALAGEKAKGTMAKAIHGHAVTWDDVAASVVEMATVIDLYNPAGNPAQPRVPAGQAGGGQFTAGQQGGQKGGRQQQPATAHQKHVAHLQHLGAQPGQSRARQKAALLKTASADRAKAAGILKQITALQKVIASAQKATGKTVKAGSNVTKATAGSTTAASASTKAAAASAAASKTAGKTASATAKVTASASQARKMLPQLQAQYKSLMTQAAQAAAAAAKL